MDTGNVKYYLDELTHEQALQRLWERSLNPNRPKPHTPKKLVSLKAEENKKEIMAQGREEGLLMHPTGIDANGTPTSYWTGETRVDEKTGQVFKLIKLGHF